MPPRDRSLSPREIFDRLEREMPDEPAECATAWKGDWDGKPWNPPAAEQPGVYAWGEAHLLYAFTLQYEATREPRYLDTFLRRFERLLAMRDDRVGRVDQVRGRVMPGWGSVRFSTRPGHEGKYTSWAVHVGMILYPAARLLRFCAEDRALAARYAGPAGQITRAIGESVAAYEDQWHEREPASGSAAGGPGHPEGYYTEPILGPDPLPTNQMNTLGRVMLEASFAASDRLPAGRYRDRVTKLARFLKNRLVLRTDGAYQWQYRPGLHPPFDAPAEDFSHASANVEFACACYRAGIVFDTEDLRRFARTFLDVAHRGGGRFSDSIDGTGDTGQFAGAAAWWGDLASVEPGVAEVIHERFYGLGLPETGPAAMVYAAMLAKHGR